MIVSITGPRGSGKSVWAKAWVKVQPESRVWLVDPQPGDIQEMYDKGLDVVAEFRSSTDAQAVMSNFDHKNINLRG